MKSILYTAAGALLILSSCSTAYKSAQTPDDVYYSPRTERTYASSNKQDQDQRKVAAASEDDGTYVTYEDEEQGDYEKRIDRFRNNYGGSYYDDGSPNVYVNNYYGGGFGYSPYSYWGGGFGYPYYRSGWNLSIGLGWGGGFYNPWYSPWYSPYSFYSPWYSPWHSPYYAGGYWGGGGYYGHYFPGGGYYSAPSRGFRSRSNFGGTYTNGNPRVVSPSGSTGSDYRPRRVFRESNTGGFNNGGRNTGGNYTPRRIFRSSPSETPTVRPGGNNNSGGGYTPRRVFQSAPSEMRSNPAPQRTFSAPSYSPPSNSGGSSGGGGGGGRTFRSRN
jgi:hypothetical protein